MNSFKSRAFSFFLSINILFNLSTSCAQVGQSTNKLTSLFNVASLSYYQTQDNEVSIKEIILHYLSRQFKPINQAVLNAGIPRQYYWIHFDITNTESTTNLLVIDIDNSRLNELELFEVSGNAAQSLGKLGDFYPFSQRWILHKNFIYEISLSPKQKKNYFLFVNQIGHTFVLPIKTYTSKNFRSTTFKDYLIDGVIYGILLFVAILSLLFFFTSKHYLYFYYGLYIITAIIWFLSYFGLGYQYIWGNYPALNTAIAPAMAAMNILLNLQICQILLKLSKTNILLNRMANYAKLALVCLALFPMIFNLNKFGYSINHNYLLAFLCTILFAMMIVSFSVILYAIKGLLAARLYLIASLLKAGSIIHLALLELGITPAAYNMEGLLQVGIFIEITLLTYALATRYTSFRLKTFVKVIEAHEKERSLISKEIHDCISNSLTGINYGIKNFTRDIDHLPVEKRLHLEKIFNELNNVQLEARNISHNTMPDYIKNRAIANIVEKYIEEIQNKARNNADGKNFIQVNFSANEQLVSFSEAVKLNIFRIIQEILANILRHSQATNADILFSFNKREMIIIAEDNGIGFAQANSENGKGIGIKNIRSRIELLDGHILIKSPIYKRNTEAGSSADLPQSMEYGTMIRIRIPYRDNLLKNFSGYDY